MKTEIIIIRHGESLGNSKRIMLGLTDLDMSERGYLQAEACAEFLLNERIDAVYSSDLKRAYNTAVPTARAFGLEVQGRKALREIYAGIWEAIPFSDVINNYAADFALWRDDFPSAYCPEGETVAELSKRVCDEVKRICEAHDGETVVIATHASPVRTIQIAATSGDASDVAFVANASINLFTYENGKLSIKQLNITDHLGDLITELPGDFDKK